MSSQLSEYLRADQRKMTQAKNYFAWQARLVLPHLGRRVVEVGAGIGNFTGLLLDRELVVAVDLDPAALGELRGRYGEWGNLRTVLCDAATGKFTDVAQFSPDSCVCLNVLEHIADDGAALWNMAAILPPGGMAVLLVPAFPTLYGPIDRNLGHFRRYTRGALAAAAKGAGLIPRRLRYMNLAGWFGWWWNAHVAGREAQSEAQIATFDRWVVPVVSRLEQWAPAPFGQSLLAVMERK
ncbi:MAG: class I SAM-dependent methyltransferase [Bryobacteraceae bacterium]|jgi:SAM-dependent methyltransferase